MRSRPSTHGPVSVVKVGVGCEVGETVGIDGPWVGVEAAGVGEMSTDEGDVPTKVAQPASDA